MRGRSALVTLLAGSFAMTACTSVMRRADRSFSQGDYGGAASAYSTALTGRLSPDDEARALYRLGLLAALPDDPHHDPAVARARLSLLLERFPGSPYTLPARAILGLQDAADASVRRGVELETAVKRLEADAKVDKDAVQAREAQIARLRAALTDTEAELKRVRSELEQLKAIDLRHRP